MEVLVTGGNGFVGHHVVDALLDRGDRVRVLALPPEDTSHLEQRGVIPSLAAQLGRRWDGGGARRGGGLVSCRCRDCHQQTSFPTRITHPIRRARVASRRGSLSRRGPLSIAFKIPPPDPTTTAHLAALAKKLTSA